MHGANFLAYIAFYSMPFLAIYLYRKKSPSEACIHISFVILLFLPAYFHVDGPGIPPIGKDGLTGLILLVILKKNGLLKFPDDVLARRLLILSFLYPFFTVVTNGDEIFRGAIYLPAVPRSELSQAYFTTITSDIIPFLAGYWLLNNRENQERLLTIFVIYAAVYGLLGAYEARMSPIFHEKIYGYFPHDWQQVKRQGGFRPVVFMGHGLLVAIFFSAAFVIFNYLSRFTNGVFNKYRYIGIGYFFLVLLACKSFGALILGLLVTPLVYFLSARRQLAVGAFVGVILVAYPLVWSSVPKDYLLGKAAGFSEERAASLNYRFSNESILIEKASERPLFGWGAWGRNRVYDPDTGRDISTTDGLWIILLGKYGWLGYIAYFGLIANSMLAAYRHSRKAKDDTIDYALCCMSLVLCVFLIDQIPNSSKSVLMMLIAGSLAGGVARLKDPEKGVVEEIDVQGARRT